jgi:hypothetical protein
VKIYGQEGTSSATGRYSLPRGIGAKSEVISLSADHQLRDPKHRSTSPPVMSSATAHQSHHADKHRRFTRLTNAFSKKFEIDARSVAIHFMNWNFVRIHQRCELRQQW